MTGLQAIAISLGITTEWREERGSWWLDCTDLAAPGFDARKLAEIMLAQQARFVTITAIEQPGGGFRMDYHWDLDGKLLTFLLTTQANTIASISDLCPAADWTEREIHDYFAVEFSGRATAPLMLRAEDKPGINLRNGRPRP